MRPADGEADVGDQFLCHRRSAAAERNERHSRTRLPCPPFRLNAETAVHASQTSAVQSIHPCSRNPSAELNQAASDRPRMALRINQVDWPLKASEQAAFDTTDIQAAIHEF